MAVISICFGLLLAALGVVTYCGAVLRWLPEKPNLTALIPAIAGVLLIILGSIALNQKLRKHAMHLAAMIALLGLAAALTGLSIILSLHGLSVPTPVVSQIIMASLCFLFLVLCVRSFINARKSRRLQNV